MINNEISTVALEIPPCPSLIYHSYRYFLEDEKHVNRISNYFVLIFMLQRSLYFSEEGIEIQVDEGEWYLQLPGLKQEGKKGSPSPEYFYLHFYASVLQPEAGELNGNIILPVRGKFNLKYIKPLLDQLVFIAKQYPRDVIGEQEIFLSILKYLSASRDKSQDISSKVIEYLKENYTKEVSCEDLTNKFHFTADYLIRKMKSLYGITPWQYILFLRIQQAKELLSGTDYTLACIANQIGFNDLSVFYKAFKKQTGVAPGSWRKSSRNID